MKFRFSASEVVTVVLVAGAIAYGYAAWNPGVLMKLRAWFPQHRDAEEAKAPVRQLVPLARQIPLCRKEGPGFQACMFKAGYAVNSAWTTAHDNDRTGPSGTLDPARVGEIVNDPYRVGPSTVYGVPYWVPRQ